MSPLLSDGDYVLCCRWSHRLARPGQVIITKHKIYNNIIKRIHRRNKGGDLILCGENSNSISMEQIGSIQCTQNIYLALLSFHQNKNLVRLHLFPK